MCFYKYFIMIVLQAYSYHYVCEYVCASSWYGFELVVIMGYPYHIRSNSRNYLLWFLKVIAGVYTVFTYDTYFYQRGNLFSFS